MVFGEKYAEYARDPNPNVGQRAWCLEEARRLESELGFSTSNFTVVPQQFFEDIGIDGPSVDARALADTIEHVDDVGFRAAHQGLVEHFARQLTPHLPALQARTQTLSDESIIIRPSPLDEAVRQDLSFAGAYKGYMPLQPMSRDEHLIWGTATMLAGRFTKYGNCYYDRHDIVGDRKVGAIYMEPFFKLGKDIPLFYGTAYIVGDHIRNEYHIAPPPDQPQRDPRLVVRRDGQVWHEHEDQGAEDAIDFTGRMARLLDGLQTHFKMPLDVEYIVDPRGDLYVVQLRRLSTKHLANWESAPLMDEANISHRSAIVDSVGTVEGRVMDLRTSVEGVNINELNGGIAIINHEPNGRGMHSQALFQLVRSHRLKGLRIVIDHGDSRLRDHLQYALAEDPGVDFIVQTTDPDVTQKLQNGMNARITSTGISAGVEALEVA